MMSYYVDYLLLRNKNSSVRLFFYIYRAQIGLVIVSLILRVRLRKIPQMVQPIQNWIGSKLSFYFPHWGKLNF
ncbi:Uncharacterised protein [Canicola haemoglobinophilus]|uniref:Uncharacterized protein n=1 Tax=Canicola haemoglobinophilus TaxID=733 RepID=A0AB38HDA0_9PAST|nr:Uncharacterised protein [Canicola haemoglobinophilus]STO68225.1 Uncharacterised protein [Canicola haemoglobinophilus]